MIYVTIGDKIMALLDVICNTFTKGIFLGMWRFFEHNTSHDSFTDHVVNFVS